MGGVPPETLHFITDFSKNHIDNKTQQDQIKLISNKTNDQKLKGRTIMNSRYRENKNDLKNNESKKLSDIYIYEKQITGNNQYAQYNNNNIYNDEDTKWRSITKNGYSFQTTFYNSRLIKTKNRNDTTITYDSTYLTKDIVPSITDQNIANKTSTNQNNGKIIVKNSQREKRYETTTRHQNNIQNNNNKKSQQHKIPNYVKKEARPKKQDISKNRITKKTTHDIDRDFIKETTARRTKTIYTKQKITPNLQNEHRDLTNIGTLKNMCTDRKKIDAVPGAIYKLL